MIGDSCHFISLLLCPFSHCQVSSPHSSLTFLDSILLLSFTFKHSTVLYPRRISPLPVRQSHDENLNQQTSHLKYWHRNKKHEKPPIFSKYVIFGSYNAGINNKRMSLETALIYGLLLNRTVVLEPFRWRQERWEQFVEVSAMKSAFSILEWDEWKARENISEDFKFYEDKHGPSHLPNISLTLRWKDYNKAIFVWPRLPVNGSEEWKDMERYACKSRKIYRDPWNVNGLQESKIIYFPPWTLFSHFYPYFYIREGWMDRKAKRMIKNHVRYREDIFDWAQRILDEMPSQFSTMHIRRGDFRNLLLFFFLFLIF